MSSQNPSKASSAKPSDTQSHDLEVYFFILKFTEKHLFFLRSSGESEGSVYSFNGNPGKKQGPSIVHNKVKRDYKNLRDQARTHEKLGTFNRHKISSEDFSIPNVPNPNNIEHVQSEWVSAVKKRFDDKVKKGDGKKEGCSVM